MELRGQRMRHTPLGEQAIVRVSLDVVGRDGLAALTMRRVADELGVAPMSLYRYVDGREGLLLRMLDAVALGIPTVETSDPRTELSEIVHRLHDAFKMQPWVVQLLVVDGLASPHIMPLMNQVFDCLFRAGLQPLAALRAWQLLFHYLAGETMTTHNTPSNKPTYGQRVFRSAGRTGLPALGVLHQFEGRHEPDTDFDANLDLLLDTIL